MYRYLPELAGLPVPRYTSYPTAAEFRGDVGAVEQEEALRSLSAGERVTLYLHVPYCEQICWYCACNTSVLNRERRATDYVDALIGEIERVGAATAASVAAIQLGGGSPNALSPEDFGRVVTALRAHFTVLPDAEFAVELDPRTLAAGFIAALADAGVNRVSLGVQTFDERVQRLINRIQPYWTIAEAVRDLRYAGIDHINFDLMYGLPGQTHETIAETIAAAIRLHPDRIAMFGYAHVPHMAQRQTMIDTGMLPDAEERFMQSALACEMLVCAGYETVGFDHYARPSDGLAIAAAERRLRRNFQGFTDQDCDAVIGLGTSAISQFEGLLIQNEKNVGQYKTRVGGGGLAGTRGVARSVDARLRAGLIERFLCDGAVDLPDDRREEFVRALGDMQRRGVVDIRGPRVLLAPWARPYARLAASAFDAYRAATPHMFSPAI